MKPSIGRIVHFHADEGSPGGAVNAAVVTKVHSDSCVNLMVLPDQASPYPLTSITERVPERPDERFTWEWPPRVD